MTREKWIEISEKMPKEDCFVDVLITSKEREDFYKRIANISFINGKFLFDYNSYKHDVNIVSWMPAKENILSPKF